MTFGQQILATLYGTIAGFVFAIVLYYVTDLIRINKTKNNLIKNLKREFEYNISLLEEWIKEIDRILLKISAHDEQVFSYLKYSYFQRLFLQECFRFGILYKSFNNEDISNLNTILLHFDINFENYINKIIGHWKDQVMPQKEAIKHFYFEKDELIKYKKQLGELLTKITK